MNVLSLYDFICERNRELINNQEIKLRSYLSHDFGIIKKNVETIKKIYSSYASEIKRTNATKFSRQKINEKKNNIIRNAGDSEIMMMDDKIKTVARRKSVLSQSVTLPQSTAKRGSFLIQNIDTKKTDSNEELNQKLSKKRFSITGLDENPLLKNFSSSENLMEQYSQYEFKIVQLNTESSHTFYKMMVGDEINTKGFSIMKTRVVLYMLLEVIISNWHIICYLGMIIYCFVNGGFSGFVFILLLVIFVVIDEGYPSLIFWRLAFFNACLSLLLKLLILEQIMKRTEKIDRSKPIKLAGNNDFFNFQVCYLLLGSATDRADSYVIILIIIQLILLDEMGIKKKKVTEFEDTSSAFIRMRLNKVFEIRYLEKFKMRQLYLSALHNTQDDLKKDGDKTQRKDEKKDKKTKGETGGSKTRD